MANRFGRKLSKSESRKHRRTPAYKRRRARKEKFHALAVAAGKRAEHYPPYSVMQRMLVEMKLGVKKPFKHKARKPGTMRPSRMPGGSGFRGWDLWEGAA